MTINTGGVLSPGNSPGVLSIAGPLTLAAGSTTIIEVDPTLSPTHDQINVSGVANIAAGAKLEVRPQGAIGAYDRTQDYTIITASGGVNGQFNAADVTSTMALLTPTLSYTTTAVNLTLTRNSVDFRDLAHTANQMAVADAAEAAGPGSAVYETLVLQTNDGARRGYDALSGEAYGAISTLLLDESRHQRRLLLRRAADAQGSAAWAEIIDGTTKLDGDANAASARDRTTGFAGGADASAGEWSLGVSLAYRRSDIDARSRGSSAEVDTWSAGVYAGRKVGGVRIAGGIEVAKHEIEAARAIAFPGVSVTVEADFEASTRQVFVGASYAVDAGPFQLSPFATVAAVRAKMESFAEAGGALGLAVAEQERDVVVSDVGMGLSRPGEVFAPRLSLAWRHVGGDVEGRSAAAFGNAAFAVTGAGLSEEALVIDAALDLRLGPGRAWLGYDGVYSDNGGSNGVKVGYALKF